MIAQHFTGYLYWVTQELSRDKCLQNSWLPGNCNFLAFIIGLNIWSISNIFLHTIEKLVSECIVQRTNI